MAKVISVAEDEENYIVCIAGNGPEFKVIVPKTESTATKEGFMNYLSQNLNGLEHVNVKNPNLPEKAEYKGAMTVGKAPEVEEPEPEKAEE